MAQTQGYGAFNNTVSMYFGIIQQREQALQQITASLHAQYAPQALTAQWNVVRTLGEQAGLAAKQAAELAKGIRETDAEYLKTLRESQTRIRTAQISADATLKSAEMDLESQSKKYWENKQNIAIKDMERGSATLFRTFEEEPVMHPQDNSTAQTWFDVFASTQVQVLPQPSNPIERAKYLDRLMVVAKQLRDKQNLWQERAMVDGSEIVQQTNPPSDKELQDFFRTEFSATEGEDYGITDKGENVSSKKVTDAVNEDVAAANRGVLGAGGNFDYDQAIRLGMLNKGDDALTRQISNALYNKLSIHNPELIKDFASTDELYNYLFVNPNEEDPTWQKLISEGKDVGSTAQSLNLWNDEAYLEQLALSKKSSERSFALETKLSAQEKKTVPEINAEAQRLYVSMHGTRLERNIQSRQDRLKAHFENDPFFEMALGDQERTIDAMPIDRKAKKEIKNLLIGRSGMLSGQERVAAFEQVGSFLDAQRERGLRVPMGVQQSLAKQFHARGLTVRGEDGSVSYKIGDQIVPQGEFTYEDMVGLLSVMVDEGNSTPEQLASLNKHLADYATSSLGQSDIAPDALIAMNELGKVIGESDIPEAPQEVPVAPTDAGMPDVGVVDPLWGGQPEPEPEPEPDANAAIELKALQTDGQEDAAGVQQQTDNKANQVSSYLSAATAVETSRTGETATPEVKEEVIAGAMKPLTGAQLNEIVDKNKKFVQNLAALGQFSQEEIDEAMIAAMPEYKDNEQVREQANAMYQYYV